MATKIPISKGITKQAIKATKPGIKSDPKNKSNFVRKPCFSWSIQTETYFYFSTWA